MGREKTTSTQTPQATPEQKELIALQLKQAKQAAPLQEQAIKLQSDVVNALLTGQSLPGELGNLLGGITDERANELARQGTENLPALFQRSGILDSGVAAEITGRSYSDILNNVAQFNLANKQNLLAQALGTGTSFQQPLLQTQASLGNTLRGLQPVRSTVSTPNPFLSNLQSSFGSNLGKTLGAGSGEKILNAFG